MKKYLAYILLLSVSACGQSTPKTGAMPGIADGGYDAPTSAEAAAAYMAGFQARYDIPELEYPLDIQRRIRAARVERLDRSMKNAKARTELMAKLGLTVLAQSDPEAKKLLKDLKENPNKAPDADNLNNILNMIDTQPKRQTLTRTERQIIYDKAVRQYKSNFRNLKVDSCRWTEMTRLIGSKHEEMAFIHGVHPTHGFRCAVELKYEKRKGYPRVTEFNDFWVKNSSGDWMYFGRFRQVDIGPRRQRLNPALLRDPEGTIMRQSPMDMIASSFN